MIQPIPEKLITIHAGKNSIDAIQDEEQAEKVVSNNVLGEQQRKN